MSTTVSRAAKILDEQCPNWFEKVNIGTLDMNIPINCIIGQVFSGPDDSHFGEFTFSEKARQVWNYSSFVCPLEDEPFGFKTNKQDWIDEINLRLAKT